MWKSIQPNLHTHVAKNCMFFQQISRFGCCFHFPKFGSTVFLACQAMVRVVWYVFLVGIFALLGSMVSSYTPWFSACGLETSTQEIVVTDTREASQNANPPTKPMPKIRNQMDSSTWSPSDVLAFMQRHPQRAYFSRLIRDGGFRVGMEVGVADGRFSEHFLTDCANIQPWTWHMVEPFPNSALVSRLPNAGAGGQITHVPEHHLTKSWGERGLGSNVRIHFHRHFSTNADFLQQFAPESLDFVYLDGAHDYANVKKELLDFWPLVRKDGILAGHDYCNYGETPLGCQGCENVPSCQPYTEYGVSHGKPKGARAANEAGVVQAVHEFLVENHPDVVLHHTLENFTRESLAFDGMDYDLIITNTRNPSWFFFKQWLLQSTRKQKSRWIKWILGLGFGNPVAEPSPWRFCEKSKVGKSHLKNVAAAAWWNGGWHWRNLWKFCFLFNYLHQCNLFFDPLAVEHDSCRLCFHIVVSVSDAQGVYL